MRLESSSGRNGEQSGEQTSAQQPRDGGAAGGDVARAPEAASKRDAEEAERKAENAFSVAEEVAQEVTDVREELEDLRGLVEDVGRLERVLEAVDDQLRHFAENAKHRKALKKFDREGSVFDAVEGADEDAEAE